MGWPGRSARRSQSGRREPPYGQSPGPRVHARRCCTCCTYKMLQTLKCLPHALEKPWKPLHLSLPNSPGAAHACTVPLARNTCAHGMLTNGRPRSWASRMHAGNMVRCEGGYGQPVCACALGPCIVSTCLGRYHEAKRSLQDIPRRFVVFLAQP